MKTSKFTVTAVLEALRECGGNRQLALAKLKCSPATLQNKIAEAKQLGMPVPRAGKTSRKTNKQIATEINDYLGLYPKQTSFPENWESLPEAPLYDSEPVAPQPATACQQSIDPELIKKAGNDYGRRLDIHIASQNWDAAQSILEEARRDSMGKLAVVPLMDLPMAETEIPVRTLNCLEERLDVLRVGDLAKVTAEQMLAVPNFGFKTLDVVRWSVLKLAATRDAMREAACMELEDLKR